MFKGVFAVLGLAVLVCSVVQAQDTEVEKLRAERDKTAKALAEAAQKLEDAEIDLILKRFPRIAERSAISKIYRNDQRVRKSLLDIDRLERIKTNPETRGNAPAKLAIDGKINAHAELLKQIVQQQRPFDRINPAPSEVAPIVRKLADQIRDHPPTPSKADNRLGIFMADLETGTTTLVADEPDKDYTYCGSPDWCQDGKRIYYDAIPTPGNLFALTHLKMIELGESEPKLIDLGPGNCPTGMPSGEGIVFLLNPNAVAGAEAGIWSMKSDGTDRSPLCKYGRPRMSPDGNHLMVINFGSVSDVALLNINTGEIKDTPLPGYELLSPPTWVNGSTIISVVRSQIGTAIALIDITDPTGLKIKEVLWKQDDKLDLFADDPVYCERTGICAFIGHTKEGRAIYTFERITDADLDRVRQAKRRTRAIVTERMVDATPKRLETGPFDNVIETLALSPDGRYVLFCSDRPGEIKK